MTQAIKKKLRSNEGASLMVALLFFVMCATVGSIILAAATASSGRLANLRKEDQSYYAITSAADLFAEMMEGKTVVIQMKKTVDSSPEEPDEEPDKTEVEFVGLDDSISNLLLPKVLKEYLLPFNSWSYDANDAKFPQLRATPVVPTDIVIKVKDKNSPSNDYESLTVNGRVTMDEALDLIVEFSIPGSSESLKMKFKSVVQEEEKIETFDANMQGTNQETDTRYTVSTKTYTISWIDPVTE